MENEFLYFSFLHHLRNSCIKQKHIKQQKYPHYDSENVNLTAVSFEVFCTSMENIYGRKHDWYRIVFFNFWQIYYWVINKCSFATTIIELSHTEILFNTPIKLAIFERPYVFIRKWKTLFDSIIKKAASIMHLQIKYNSEMCPKSNKVAFVNSLKTLFFQLS